MTTTPLFQGLAQDATLLALEALFQPNIQAAGFAGIGSVLQPDVTNRPIVTVQTTGQSGSVTIVPQVSDDNATWTTIAEVDAVENVGVATGVNAASITANGSYRVNTLGFPYFRLYQSAGSGSTSVAASASPGVGAIRLGVGGAVRIAAQAAGAADPGIGAFGFRAPATPAARSAAAAWTALMADQEGKQVVVPHGATEVQWQSVPTTLGATAAPVKAAGATGIRNFLTWLTVDNNSAAAIRVVLLDGTTAVWSGSCPANDSRHFTFPTPIKGTAATALNGSIATGSGVVTAGGFLGI